MFDFRKFKLSLSMLVLALAAIGFAGCGSSGGGSSLGGLVSEKTISGVALDAKGIAFASGTPVSVIDANGNTATGKVGDNGEFSLLLAGVSSAGKKGKEGDVKGSILIQVGEGSEALTSIIGDGDSKASVNAVTSAGTQTLGLEIDFDAAFTEAKAKGKITNTSLLDSLKGLNHTPEEVKRAVQQVLDSVFGVDAEGKPAVSVDKYTSTGLRDTDTTAVMLQSLFNFNGDSNPTSLLLARAVEQVPDSVLNNPEFYSSVSRVLATKELDGKPLSFENFINGVIDSSKVKDSIKKDDLIAEMIAIIAALVLDQNADTTVNTSVAGNAVSQEVITVSVTRGGATDDTISYSTTSNVLEGDIHTLSVKVLDASEAISIKVDLKKGANGLQTASNVSIYTGDLVVNLSTNSIDPAAATIDLAKALEEVRAKLVAEKLNDIAGKIPASTSGRSLKMSTTPVRRGSLYFKTFLQGSTGSPALSTVGITLTSDLATVSGTPVDDGTTSTTAGFFKGNFDGADFQVDEGVVTTSSLAAVRANNLITVSTGFVYDSASGSTVSISFVVPDTAGTHDFTGSNIANVIQTVVGNPVVINTLGANASFGSGSVTITEISATVVKGTVNITATDANSSGTLVLTGGEFSINITQ